MLNLTVILLHVWECHFYYVLNLTDILLVMMISYDNFLVEKPNQGQGS